jgi:hypothetical protein
LFVPKGEENTINEDENHLGSNRDHKGDNNNNTRRRMELKIRKIEKGKFSKEREFIHFKNGKFIKM